MFIRSIIGRVFVCALPLLISCNPTTRQAVKDSLWEAADCSSFAALSCAGQSVGVCSIDHKDEADYAGFSNCLVDSTPSCIASNVGRCLLSGIVRATGSLVFAGGGVGCTTPADVEDVKICVQKKDTSTEKQAVAAVASCWKKQCSR